MSYFNRSLAMQRVAKAFKNAGGDWDESRVNRGKTTAESNDGSFAPKGGAATPSDKTSPDYVNQESWTRSNKQPSSAEMRQHGQGFGQRIRDVADATPGSPGRLKEYHDQVASEYGADYAKQAYQSAVDDFQNPAQGARTAALDAAADKAVQTDLQRSLDYKQPDKVGIGTVMASSWGYGQTNMTYYEVTGMSPSGKTVTLRELAQIDRSKEHKADGSGMSGYTRPLPGKYTGTALSKRLQGDRVKISSYANASMWDGKDDFHSWWH